MTDTANRVANRHLRFDASKEQFYMPEANKPLRRNDRKAHAVPERV